MNIFVIIASVGNLVHEYGVFATEEEAEAYKAIQEIPENSIIIPLPVYGEIEQAGVVYAGWIYDASLGLHYFKGVYGSQHLALSKVGEMGRVLKRVISR